MPDPLLPTGACAAAEASAALSCSWHLAVLGGPDAGAVLALADGTERVIGRGGALTDPYVSREHLRVRAAARGVSIIGAPGANGARWHGLRERARGRGRAGVRAGQRWQPGSRLRVGDSVLELRRRPDDLQVPLPDGPRASRSRARASMVLAAVSVVVAVGIVVVSLRSGYGARSLMLVPLALMGLMRLGGFSARGRRRRGRCGWQGRRPDPAGMLLAVARSTRAAGTVPAADDDVPRAWCGRRGRRSAIALGAGDALALTGAGALEAVRWWTCQVLASAGAEVLVDEGSSRLAWGSGSSRHEAMLAAAPDAGPPATVSQVRATPGSRGWRRDAGRLSGTWWGAVTHMSRASERARGGPGGDGSALPHDVRLEEVCGELDRERVRSVWRKPASGLGAVLGVDTHGPVSVDLVADGPHALLAGTTGSGKSELLTSWLLQLAAGHPPHRLSLVLVDYKGGAAFGRLARLPHTAGVLTDLDHAMTSRALSCLSAEVRRRERVLAAHGAPDVQAMREEDRPARLVLVVDEFAVLSTSHPEVLDSLIRVAAQGRSLGIHLVLATQRPAGVVSAAVRANAALRVCLRVLDGADSRDVLGNEDAARLEPVAGRLLVAGSRREGPLQALHAGDGPQVSQMVEELRAAAEDAPPPWCPWAPPLPTRVTRGEAGARPGTGAVGDSTGLGADGALRAPRTDGARGASVLMAVTDLPEEQAQGTWSWDPATTLLVLGAADSGRSTTLVSAAAGALKLGLQVHLCGLPAASVTQLSSWPGLGTVVGAEDPRRLARLWSLAAAGRVSGVLVLDGAEELVAAVDELLGPTEGTALLEAVRRGATMSGAGLVVSASLSAGTARWTAPLRTRIVLGADEPAQAAMAGLPRGRLCGRGPGRGLLLVEGTALDCQVVLADEAPAPASDAVQRLGPGGVPCATRAYRAVPAVALRATSQQVAGGPAPLRLAPLPLLVAPRPGVWALGGDDAAALPVPEGPVLVLGPHGSGRTTALRGLERVLREAGEEEALVVDDLDLADPQDLAAVGEALAQGRRVLGSATTERAAATFRGPLADLRSRGALVVLWPAVGPAAQAAGMGLRAACDPRHPTTPGRGALVLRGEVTALQTASAAR